MEREPYDRFDVLPMEGPLGSALQPDIEAEVASNVITAKQGLEGPLDVELEPLLEIDPVESFDYKSAGKTMTSKQVLDIMQVDPKYNNTFDFAKARDSMSDDQLYGLLDQSSEKSKTNLARSKAYHAGIDNDFTLGALKAQTGMQVLVEDLKFWKDDGEKDREISRLQSFANDMERARSDKDFFSMFTLGDMGMQIAALPFSAQSRSATFAIEGVLGYSSGRSDGSVGEAAVEGAVSGTAGAAIAHFLRGFNGLAVEDSLAKLKEEHLTTDGAVDAFDAYKKEWFQTNRVDTTTQWKANYPAVNETAALVDYLGDQGQLIAKSASRSLKAERVIRDIRQQRMDGVNEVLGRVDLDDVAKTGKALQQGMETISTDFGRVIDSMGIQKTDNTLLINATGDFSEEALMKLDEATRTDLRSLKDLLDDNTVNSLVKANQHINSIIRKTSKNNRAKKYNLNELQKTIDNKIMDTVGKNKYLEWEAMNKDYAMMATIRDSKLNEYIQDATNGITTAEDALKRIHGVSGKQLFTDVDKLIGTEAATKLELLTMKEAFSNSKSTTWAKLGTQVDGKGFITPEGKALREVIQRYSDMFNVDAIVTKGINSGDIMQGGAKSDLVNQVKGTFFHELFMSVQRRNPLSDIGKQEASLKYVTNVLKSPQQLQDFITKADNFSKPIAHRHIESIIKQLPRYPDKSGGVIKNLKNPTNPVQEANIAKETARFKEQVQSNRIQEGLDNLFKDAMYSKLANSESNRVIKEAFKHFDGMRFPDKMSKIANSMQAGKEANNAKLMQAVIEGEASMMAKAIAKDHGVKVDKQMMEDLVLYVTEQAMKDCK